MLKSEEWEEYPESYFVSDDKESFVIIKGVDDNITETTITKSNNDTTTTTTTTVVVLSEEDGVMAEQGVIWVKLVRDRAQKLSFLISRSACWVDLSLFAVKASKVVQYLSSFKSMY